MVDSISSNMPASLGGHTDPAYNAQRPEPAVQVTHTAAGRNGGNATTQQEQGYSRSGASPDEAFEEINAAMDAWSTGMRFELDEDTQQMVVSIIDTKSGDVLRQIPSEEVLHVAKMIAQFQGKLLSVKA